MSQVAHSPKSHWTVRFSSPDPLPGQVLPPRFPLVLENRTGMVCEPALLFLYERHVQERARDPSRNTLVAYAHDLKEWFQYLEEFQLGWANVLSRDVVGFVKVMRATISPETKEAYSTKTIKRRVSTVLAFYDWAMRSRFQWIFADESASSIQTLQKKPSALSLRQRADEPQHVSLINPSQATAILDAAGAPIRDTGQRAVSPATGPCKHGDPYPTAKSSRNRLAMEIALQTGLRVTEVCCLRKDQFIPVFSYDNIPDTKTFRVKVKGKGAKVRQVAFPGVLIKSILKYIEVERSAILESCTLPHPEELLINPSRSGGHYGKRVTARTLERAFARACVESGNSREVAVHRFDSDGKVVGKTSKRAPEFVFHDLRHTYAIWTYYARARAGDSEPWLYLQQQLGHAHLETTLGIYLSSAPQFEGAVSDATMRALNEDN